MHDDIARKRFHARYLPEPNSGCWLWVGYIGSHGYGEVTGRKTQREKMAHRRAWQLFHGIIPEGAFICHRCDVKICVNPSHLFVGTAATNMQDMWEKNRQGGQFKKGFDLRRIRRSINA